jgi:hypothetical protein
VWRPLLQPQQVLEIPGWGSIVRAWQNNEPIGPGSSVRSDDDPVRIVMHAVNTWLSEGAAFVYHSGAGIRRGDAAWEQRPERQALRIPVNPWQTPHYAETIAGFKAVRAALPADLPNWRSRNASDRSDGYPFDPEMMEQAFRRGDLVQAFGAVHTDGRFVVAPIGVRRTAAFMPRSAMQVELINPMTGALIESRQLRQGETWSVPAGSAYLIRGRIRS